MATYDRASPRFRIYWESEKDCSMKIATGTSNLLRAKLEDIVQVSVSRQPCDSHVSRTVRVDLSVGWQEYVAVGRSCHFL